MMWLDVVGLIKVTRMPNDYNERIPVDGDPREVFANVKSVGSREFYQAAVAGIKPEIIVELMKVEYDGEQKAQHDGTTYHVIRSYSKGGDKIELTCSRYPMEV